MMKHSLLLAPLALAALAAAAALDPIKIVREYREGTTQKQKMSLTMSVGGAEAKVTADWTLKVASVKDGEAALEVAWDNAKVEYQGSELPAPISETTVRLLQAGTIKKVTGGVQGTDPVHTFLLVHFFTPPAEVSTGGLYEIQLGAVPADGIPAVKISGKYLGMEKVGDVEAHKFSQKIEEKDATFKTDGTFWVKADGTTVKAEVNFTDLPVPAAGDTGSGKVTIIAQ